MLKNARQNFHHSKLPPMGAIVTLPELHRPGKFMVESFNLCDSSFPYSLGIHLVNLVNLADRNQKITVSGIWCEEVG